MLGGPLVALLCGGWCSLGWHITGRDKSDKFHAAAGAQSYPLAGILRSEFQEQQGEDYQCNNQNCFKQILVHSNSSDNR